MARTYDLSAWIIAVVFFGGIGYFVLALLTTPHFKIASIIPVLVSSIIFYASNWEYMLIVHQPKFHFKTGVLGTLDGPIDFSVPGRRFKAKVWLKRRIFRKLPNKENITVLGGGKEGFLGILTGDVLTEFVGKLSNLRIMTGKYSELEEGSYLYDGSVSGIPVPTEHQLLRNEIDYLDTVIVNNSTMFERLKALATQMAASEDKGVIAYSKKIDLITKEALEARRPIVYYPPTTPGGRPREEVP